MSDWNPSLYLHFAAERSRPAVELLARVPLENIEYIADLGCGPGNSTALLYQRWPAARITGVDSSPAMIAETRSALPDCLNVRTADGSVLPDNLPLARHRIYRPHGS
ncbi:methyltransferase domain-containing protein [Escherichia coli]|nr:methyltransferase domain-containing protein [Escherichia coli]